MSVIHVNAQNFEQLQSGKVLLDFYADWCGPCRMIAPLVEEIADENPNVTVGKINVDEEPELAQRFGVASIPMLVVLQDGQVVNQAVGARPKEHIQQLLG